MKLIGYVSILLVAMAITACNGEKEPVKTNLLIATTNGNLYNINLATGKIQWQILDHGRNDELTYFTQNGPTLLRAFSDQRIVEIDKSTGKVNWIFTDQVSPHHKDYGYDFSGVAHLLFAQYPIIKGSNFLFGSSMGEIKAVDLKTRKVKWTHQIHQPVYASPIIFSNKLVINANAFIGALNLTNGQTIATFDLETPSFLAPVVKDNLLYVVDEDGGVYCLGNDLNLVWKHTAEIDMFQQTKLNFTEEDIVYGDTALVSINRKDGKLNWRTVFPQKIDKKGKEYVDEQGFKVFGVVKNNLLQSVEVVQNEIMVNTPHYLLLIDKDSGKILKQKYFVNKETIGQMKYYSGFFYYLCSDNNLYKIDRDLKTEHLVTRNIKYQTERAIDDTYIDLY